MSKLVLIHGFAVNLSAPIIRPPFGPEASFRIFKSDVESVEAAVFSWGFEKRVSPFRLLDPFFWIKIYKTEKAMAADKKTLEQLQDFLEQENPEIIICHSMGCFLLNNFCKNFSLPNSVKKIIFVQSDDSSPSKISSNASESRGSTLFNLYCPWDPTLIISTIFNRKLRAGLLPNHHADKNIFWPLFLPINFHTSTIRDKQFKKFSKEEN